VTATVAFIAFAIAYFMRADLTPDASFESLVWPMMVQGVAMSLFFVALVTISLQGVPPQRIPLASGLSNFSRITAGSFAASISTTLWDRREALHQTRLSEGISVYDPTLTEAVATLHATGLSYTEALAVWTRTLINQAYAMASLDYFWLSGCLVLVMLPVVWLARGTRRG
jgi:DHA2 family multidrug resistance protein